MKHKQGEQTFYNPEMGLLWPPGDLYGHHSEQEHRASLLACTVTLDCFQLLLEEWTNCIWFLSILKLTAIVCIVMISRNISPKRESFPPNCSALSAVTGRLHQDRWFLDHPNYFLKSLTKWSQMITSHQYGMWGFWNDSTYIVIIRGAVSRIPFWNICHICHLSDIYGWKWEFISSPDCQSDHWFNLAPFVAAPERARWAIRGQNHCNYSTLPVSPGNFLIYKF